MTTNRDIVAGALRKLGALRAGGTPQAGPAEAALSVLDSIYGELVEQAVFGRLNDVIPSADYLAREQDRVLNTGGFTITLPSQITTPNPNGPYAPYGPLGGEAIPYVGDYGWSPVPLPPGASSALPPRHQACIVVVTGGVPQISLWNAYTGTWARLDAPKLTDPFPFAQGMQDGFSCLLAMRLVDEYGGETLPSKITEQTAMRCMSTLTRKPDTRREPVRAEWM